MIIIKLIFWKYHDIRILLWYISLIYRTYHWYFRANPAGVWQTDRRTDILLRHSPRYAYASRGKNRSTFAKVMSRLERHVFWLTVCLYRRHRLTAAVTVNWQFITWPIRTPRFLIIFYIDVDESPRTNRSAGLTAAADARNLFTPTQNIVTLMDPLGGGVSNRWMKINRLICACASGYRHITWPDLHMSDWMGYWVVDKRAFGLKSAEFSPPYSLRTWHWHAVCMQFSGLFHSYLL